MLFHKLLAHTVLHIQWFYGNKKTRRKLGRTRYYSYGAENVCWHILLIANRKKLFIGTSVKSLEYRHPGAQQFFIQCSFLKSFDVCVFSCFWAFLYQMVVKTARLNNNSKSYSMFKTWLMFQNL